MKTLLIFSLLLQPVLATETPKKALIVVAHPDDEYYVAGTVYRMAKQLNCSVDELIITNGEGGFRYSSLAEAYYNEPLTTEAVGRKELPAIRKRESLNAGKILGIRNHYFLDQVDEKFTTDIAEGLDRLWDSRFVTEEIVDLLKGQHYQYVFTVLPRSTTHGHHQAATVLATRAVRELPEGARPVLLSADTDPAAYGALPAFAETNVWGAEASFSFDREFHFGFNNALSYQIVVSWMIAEHKSQGLFQTMYGKEAKEYFWVDTVDTPHARERAEELFRKIEPSGALLTSLGAR